jgi:hypothetical protein
MSDWQYVIGLIFDEIFQFYWFGILGRGAPSAPGGSPYGAGGSASASGVKSEYEGLGGGPGGWGSPHGDGGPHGPPMTPTSPTGSALSSP